MRRSRAGGELNEFHLLSITPLSRHGDPRDQAGARPLETYRETHEVK
jgi:hypothetical protein